MLTLIGEAVDLFANGDWCDGAGGGVGAGDSGFIELGLFSDLNSFDICDCAWLLSFDLPCGQQNNTNELKTIINETWNESGDINLPIDSTSLVALSL